MAINAFNLNVESDLNRVTDLAFRGHHSDPQLLDSALLMLNKCGLNDVQATAVANILRTPCSEDPVQATKEMKDRIIAALSYPIADQLCLEIVEKIFSGCLSNRDYKGLSALARVNWHWNECLEASWDRFNLKQFCPGLNILDAKERGTPVDDEPLISKLAILKSFKELAPHVEGNAGCTLLTMCKGDTLNQFVKTAAEMGMTISFGWEAILQGLGDIPIAQSYLILITNSIFIESRSETIDQHKKRVAQHGCEMPTVQEYVALCVFTKKIFDQCLYEENPLTLGRSSTCVANYYSTRGTNYLVIGGSSPDRFYVSYIHFGADEDTGAGGRRKF